MDLRESEWAKNEGPRMRKPAAEAVGKARAMTPESGTISTCQYRQDGGDCSPPPTGARRRRLLELLLQGAANRLAAQTRQRSSAAEYVSTISKRRGICGRLTAIRRKRRRPLRDRSIKRRSIGSRKHVTSRASRPRGLDRRRPGSSDVAQREDQQDTWDGPRHPSGGSSASLSSIRIDGAGWRRPAATSC